MLRFVLALCLVLGLPATAAAQDLAPGFRAIAGDADEPAPLHVTRALIHSADGQEALRLLKAWQDDGAAPMRKNGAYQAVVGQVQSFILRENLTSGSSSTITVDFTLMYQHAEFDIWVETSLLSPSGPVQQSDVDVMAVALGSSTPAGSFNPNQGIIVNDEAIFGPPPDVDGDGRTDVLLHDIKDSYDPANGQTSAILGYFDPSDLTRYNFRDIIHIDVMPGMFDQSGNRRNPASVQQTLAHEYQHLIFSRVNPSGDAAFVDEGLAEWAEVQNGFTARSITYLSSAPERSGAFMEWRDGGGPGSVDYERAGLFTNYFSERVGVLDTGALARSTGQDAGNYILELNRLTGGDGANTLKTFLQGFHIANILNDQSVAADYGHARAQYAGIRATNITTYDGRAALSTPTTPASTSAGGVVYAQWTDVANFSASVFTTGSTNASHLRPVVIGVPDSGTPSIVDLDANGEGAVLSGEYARVLLVVPHVDITTTQRATFTYAAGWSARSSVVTFEDVAWDTGSVYVENGAIEAYSLSPSALVPEDGRFANRFTTPTGMYLESVSVAVYYENQFGGSQATSNAKDFRIRLYASTDDSAPLPGTELLTLDVVDTVTQDPPAFSFHTVDLSAYEDILRSLPETFFVSVENAGSDDNYIAVGLSTFAGADNPGALYYPFSGDGNPYSWRSFNTITGGGTLLFDERAIPVRARFSDRLVGTATDEPDVLPVSATLDQNYPNPFNPSTSISFSLPDAGPVRLAVYDVLGREVAVLVDGFRAAGQHKASFDAGRLTSGMYLYRLETGTAVLSRSMLLVK